MGFFSSLFGGSSSSGSSSGKGSSGKTSEIWFSKEHVGSSGKLETDTYRSVDGGRTEKIAHNPCEQTKIPTNK